MLARSPWNVRVRHGITQARLGFTKVAVTVIDEELLAGGDGAVGREYEALAAAVRDPLDVQVRIAVVVDKASGAILNS